MKKVFVGNLPFSVDDDKLKALFAHHGAISESIVIKNKFSGRSKGFGFVTFSNDEEGTKAIADMNGKEIEGRKLTVNEATPFNPDAPRKPFHRDGNRSGFAGRRFGPRRENSDNESSESDSGSSDSDSDSE